jgi:periplasmic divalent cation tolerance protein
MFCYEKSNADTGFEFAVLRRGLSDRDDLATNLYAMTFMNRHEIMTDSSEFNQYYLVWVSAGSEAEAIAIAQALVQEKLAACINITPMTSVYTWQSQLCQDREWQLSIKTKRICFEALKQRVVELHSYEVPEIIAVPIEAGSQNYLSWIDANVHPK